MSRKHCIRAATRRWSTRAVSLVGPAMTVIQYCHEARRLWLRIRVHLPRAANEVRHLTSGAGHSADHDVRLCGSEFACTRFPPDGARAWRRTLSAQTVHAACAARRHQRLPCGASSRRRRRPGRAIGLACAGHYGHRVTVRLPRMRTAQVAASTRTERRDVASSCGRLGSMSRRPRLSSFTSGTFQRASPAVIGPFTSRATTVAALSRFCRKALPHAVELQTSLQSPY